MEKSIVTSNISGTTTKLTNSKSYSNKDSITENNLYSSDYSLTAGSKSRDDWLMILINSRSSNVDESKPKIKVNLFPDLIMNEEPLISKWLPFIGTTENESNYSSVLIKNIFFWIMQTHQIMLKGPKSGLRKLS